MSRESDPVPWVVIDELLDPKEGVYMRHLVPLDEFCDNVEGELGRYSFTVKDDRTEVTMKSGDTDFYGGALREDTWLHLKPFLNLWWVRIRPLTEVLDFLDLTPFTGVADSHVARKNVTS